MWSLFSLDEVLVLVSRSSNRIVAVNKKEVVGIVVVVVFVAKVCLFNFSF